MVRDGLFKDVDVAVSWPPGDRNEASPTSSTANITAKFRFHGVAAHAAAAPHPARPRPPAGQALDHMVKIIRRSLPPGTPIPPIVPPRRSAPNRQPVLSPG